MNTGPQKENELGAKCVLQQATDKHRQNSDAQIPMWGCVLIPASVCIMHKYIFEDCLTLHWQKQYTKCKHCNFLALAVCLQCYYGEI